MKEPIIALATPPMKGALAVIRTSGEGIFEITDEFFSKKISGTSKRSCFVGAFSDDGKPIDQIVLIAYPGPNSVTGEDVVELVCHGSMLIANQIIEAYLSKGVRYASRGEFSSRAFYNGKMDLIEAEAVNDIINATTKEAKDLAYLSLSGETSKLALPIKNRIAGILAAIETSIEYPDYGDLEIPDFADIESKCENLKTTISKLIEEGNQGRIVKEGIKVAIVGEPNVGKSSLLNALLEEDKAIVSDIPGTTRDIVEGDINIKGVAVHLLDTAGIRESSDFVETLGIKRSEKSIEEADLVVLVLDASKPNEGRQMLSMCEGKKTLVCYNKADLIDQKEEGKVYISASSGDISAIKDAIFESLCLGDVFGKPSLSNPRQLGILKEIDAHLSKAIEDSKNELPLDLVSVSLLSAYNKARELLGEEHTLDLGDEIFSRFCVGK